MGAVGSHRPSGDGAVEKGREIVGVGLCLVQWDRSVKAFLVLMVILRSWVTLKTWGRARKPDPLPPCQLRMGIVALLPAHSHGLNKTKAMTACCNP